MAENIKTNTALNTCKQLLVSDDNIVIQDRLKRFLDSLHNKEHVDAQYLQIKVSIA